MLTLGIARTSSALRSLNRIFDHWRYKNTAGYIFIFEFKLDKSTDEALRQIEDKGYAGLAVFNCHEPFKLNRNSAKMRKKHLFWRIFLYLILFLYIFAPDY